MEHPPAVAETFTIRYHITRNVLLGIWWRRLLLRPIRLCFYAVIILIVVAINYRGFGDFGLYLAGFLFLYLVAVPFALWFRLAKIIDETPLFVDPKTAEFSPSHLIVSGPNWRSELPWTTYRAFSEDKDYFFLGGSNARLPAVIPKSGFTPGQMDKFRAYATAHLK